MLEAVSYCPMLLTRIAEMKALAQLPAPLKDRLFPVLSLRPWPNAKKLQRTTEKLQEALGQRRFALDLDASIPAPDDPKESWHQFKGLFSQAGGFENYFGFISELPAAVPVVRTSPGGIPDLDGQVEHLAALDRGAVIRVCYEGGYAGGKDLHTLIGTYKDTVVAVDAGWSVDLLGREAWAAGVIDSVVKGFPETEIILAGSSFPESFVNIKGEGANAIVERRLFEDVARGNNAANLTYGDWGSTRPPRPSSPMKLIRRVDLPKSREWLSFREKDGENWSEIAQRAKNSPDWPSTLTCWGTYTILSTIDDLPGAIRSPGTAAAARINIHLHRQAQFDTPDVNDGDEPFTEDF